MAESEHSSLYPIAVLIDELRSDDLSRRLNSISNLRTISIALGPERTRNELIPYLSELIDDEEQFLLALADILSTMVDCVGGRNYAHILFEPLEQLCQVEESSVRLAAITSFKSIFLQVDMTILEPVIEDMIRRINEGEFFTGKCGVAMLIPICIENMTLATQRKFLEIFKDILNNNQPQVRKSGAESLKLISNLYVTHETVLIECLKIIASDKEDTVRLLTVDNFISFCKIVPESRINPIFIPILRSLLEDKS